MVSYVARLSDIGCLRCENLGSKTFKNNTIISECRPYLWTVRVYSVFSQLLNKAAHYHSHLDRLVLTALRRMWLNVIRFYPQNVFYIEYSFLSQATASQWSLTWQCLCDKHMYITGKVTPLTKHSGQPYSSFLSLSLATSCILFPIITTILAYGAFSDSSYSAVTWRKLHLDANFGDRETQIDVNREFNIAFAWMKK